jgi:hypothetical protein
MSGKSIHLIDRDELLAVVQADMDISITGEQNMKAVKKMMQNILDDIKESPVVDAIPIDWLICKRNEHNNDGFAWIYEAVMDDWRKDNGSVD